jgi:hypothetical protein
MIQLKLGTPHPNSFCKTLDARNTNKYTLFSSHDASYVSRYSVRVNYTKTTQKGKSGGVACTGVGRKKFHPGIVNIDGHSRYFKFGPWLAPVQPLAVDDSPPPIPPDYRPARARVLKMSLQFYVEPMRYVK